MKLVDLEKLELSDNPGVYFFMKTTPGPSLARGEKVPIAQESILYIGKATSLKSRVKSYFDNDILHTRGLHIANMVTLADTVKFIETRSVLEALLLETELIKKHLPKYNTISKDDKSFFVLVITEENFPRVVLARKRDIDLEKMILLKSKFLGQTPSPLRGASQREASKYGVAEGFLPLGKVADRPEGVIKVKKFFGPYPSGQYAKESLKLIRRIFPFRDKCNVFDKKTPWKKQPCFSYQIGLCPGTCAGVCDKKKYQKIIERLITFLEGDGEKVRKDLEEDMKNYAKELKFEEAQKVKETLFALEHIRDAHLISKDINEEDRNIRIEAYDIAHLSGSERVGVMTVVLGGVVAKHEYKKFKISTDQNDDLGGLKELFERRMGHLEWGLPDIIVVDGDKRHVEVVNKILGLEHPSLWEGGRRPEGVRVVAATKNKSHKVASLIGDKETLGKYQKEIILANAEAHRFALSYHKNLRKKSFLKP